MIGAVRHPASSQTCRYPYNCLVRQKTASRQIRAYWLWDREKRTFWDIFNCNVLLPCHTTKAQLLVAPSDRWLSLDLCPETTKSYGHSLWTDGISKQQLAWHRSGRAMILYRLTGSGLDRRNATLGSVRLHLHCIYTSPDRDAGYKAADDNLKSSYAHESGRTALHWASF